MNSIYFVIESVNNLDSDGPPQHASGMNNARGNRELFFID